MTTLFVILGIIIGCATFGVFLGWLFTHGKKSAEETSGAGHVSG